MADAARGGSCWPDLSVSCEMLTMTEQGRRPWRALRLHLGWTQEEAARRARVTLSTYRRWETGRGVEGPASDPAWALITLGAGLPEDWTPPGPVTDPTPE